MHLAAAEGCYQVLEWLMESGADVNQLDRFKRTPLEDAVKANSTVVAKLLMSRGGRIWEGDRYVELEQSTLANRMGFAATKRLWDLSPEWEIDRDSLEILDKLGEGEFGVVHRARWAGTLVAAKLLKGSSEIYVGDFQAEIETLRNVHHPNAVQFLGACTRSEPYVLVTELMAGGSLADAFLLPQAFTQRRALEIALDAARGLAYLHHSRHPALIHRDLKPGNLMLAGSLWQTREQLAFDSGVCKIADFGLSKTLPTQKLARGEDLISGTYKLTGETGSYRYMAPEVFRHEPYNSSVDVYSYAMIVYQLFEHAPPFVGMDAVAAARAASTSHTRPSFVRLKEPKQLNAEIRELIARCWAPNPDDRPGFREVCAVLEGIIVRAPSKGKHPRGNGGLPAEAIAAAAAAAAAGGPTGGHGTAAAAAGAKGAAGATGATNGAGGAPTPQAPPGGADCCTVA